jgi:two-component system sensor histidine kinase UhpB
VGQKLDILMLEDVASDAEIVEYDLRKAKIKFTYRRVDTREDFLEELERKIPDLILADYSLPNFDGLTALGLARKICPETPFIFVSGTMGEEVAIDTLQKGATDYVLKQRLERLGPSVERALREAEERRQRWAAEEKLRESEELFRTLFQTAGSVIGVVSPQGRILEFNPEAERVTGWQRQEVLGRGFLRLFVPPAYKETVLADMEKVLAGEPTRGLEIPIKLRHGGERLFLWNVNRLLGKEGQLLGVIAVGQDITERQLAVEALGKSAQRLRFLTSQVLTAQEKERKRISRELHDELGQALMLLKLNLRAADRQLPEASEVKAEIRGMSLYLDEVIDKVRRLSRDLSPAILEDLGLLPALHYLIDEFSKHYQITHAFDLQELDQLFTKEAQIILYRIFQEALTNIARHAGATNVRLAIQKSADTVLFEVEDNGKGFEVARALSRHSRDKGLGLAALEERAKMLDGVLIIRSREGAGTLLAITIPVAPSK